MDSPKPIGTEPALLKVEYHNGKKWVEFDLPYDNPTIGEDYARFVIKQLVSFGLIADADGEIG